MSICDYQHILTGRMQPPPRHCILPEPKVDGKTWVFLLNSSGRTVASGELTPNGGVRGFECNPG